MNRSRFLFRLAVTACFTPLFSSMSAQEQLGMRLENYAGIYAATINPANTAYNPNRWEFSLFTAEAFFENNYAFLKNTSLQRALRNTDKIVSVEDGPRETPASDAILLDYFNGNRKMHAVVQSRVTGPGFSFRLGDKHVLGLTTAIRSEVSSYKIPEILAYRTISDLPRNQAVNIAPTGLTGMVWGEIGLHYSRQNTDGDLHTAWGVSPKYLMGFEGLYTRAQSSFDYTQRLGDTVAFGSADWEYALTLGNVSNSDNVRLRRQGGGVGLDAGFSWAKPADEEGAYAWRLGVSVVDLGFVRFNRNAERHYIAFDTVLTVSNTDFPSRDNLSEVMGDVSQAFLGNPDASLQGRQFTIGLPTALSVQAEVRIQEGLYVAVLLTQRTPLFAYNVKRPNTLAVVPRIERRWWSFSLPVVLNDWQSLRVGAAARIGWLYIGSDQIGSFFNKNRLTGADFYVGLKINAFSLNVPTRNRLTRETRHHRGRQQLGKIKCYKF